MRLFPPFNKNGDTRPPNATIDATMAVNWWALLGYFNSAAINDACAKLRELSLRSAGGGSHFYQINSGIFYAKNAKNFL